jgi:hypothetical protein
MEINQEYFILITTHKSNWICDCDVIQPYGTNYCPVCRRPRKKVKWSTMQVYYNIAWRYGTTVDAVRYHFRKGKGIREVTKFYENKRLKEVDLGVNA